MQNYRKSDYAINKNSPNIVYCFHNEIIEITLEDYLKEKPDKTEHDFAELKALSDQIYYEQDRAESAQTRKDVSIHGLEETEHCAIIIGLASNPVPYERVTAACKNRAAPGVAMTGKGHNGTPVQPQPCLRSE